ncbi:peptide chain release factor N(5)-glutamine methyltransferase [candidate division KSB1 bacterium]|nr:peptide chain release factor N(5)-glutamine methyltransferase [candidate division KSB1 bacterium]
MSTQHLAEKGFENPRLNVERLLASVLKMNRIDLYLNFERPIAEPELNQFKTLLQRRLKYEPLQYILATTEFMSLPFKVDRRSLIPRPETEILVQTVLDRVQSRGDAPSVIRILDIGTGSGNIAVSLAKYLPQAQVTALDIAADALAMARENAELNGVLSQLDFVNQDIAHYQTATPFQVIVSNPPYVTSAEWEKLPWEIKLYEPRLALDGGVDGMAGFQKIIARLPALLVTDGLAGFEMDPRQAPALEKILLRSNYQSTRIPDLNQQDRVILIHK